MGNIDVIGFLTTLMVLFVFFLGFRNLLLRISFKRVTLLYIDFGLIYLWVYPEAHTLPITKDDFYHYDDVILNLCVWGPWDFFKSSEDIQYISNFIEYYKSDFNQAMEEDPAKVDELYERLERIMLAL
jgi:hypothetical protein